MSYALSGVVTPQAYFLGLLGELAQKSVAAPEVEIAATVDSLAVSVRQFGHPEMADRLAKVYAALTRGEVRRTQLDQLPVLRELRTLRLPLEEGRDLVGLLTELREAKNRLKQIEGTRGIPPSILARPAVHPSIGPPPEIQWASIGTKKHPLIPPTGVSNATAGKRLTYLALYVMFRSGHDGEEASVIENFYQLNAEQRRRLENGAFVPKALGQFSSQEARMMITKAASLEPILGKFIQELIIHAVFESQGWSLGIPLPQAGWDIYMLYWLRRYVAIQIISGNKKILEDAALVKMVQGKSRLADVKWHLGETHREALEQWIPSLRFGSPKSPENHVTPEIMRKRIGDDVMKSWKWEAPKNGSGWELQVQWMVRQWIAYYHYGVLPARGLPFDVDVIRRFAVAKPSKVQPQFARQLLAMMRDYFSKVELDAVGGIIK